MRQPLSEEEAARQRAAHQLMLVLGRKPKKHSPSIPKAKLEKWRAEVQQMLGKTGCRWEPCHLVALYRMLHEWCYGVEDTSVCGQEAFKAVGSARAMVAREYNGSYRAAVDFIRWAWREEKRKEQWARDNCRQTHRLTWYKLFKLPDLHVQYRISQERARVYARRQGNGNVKA